MNEYEISQQNQQQQQHPSHANTHTEKNEMKNNKKLSQLIILRNKTLFWLREFWSGKRTSSRESIRTLLREKKILCELQKRVNK